jgi:hypothetical protein
MSALKSDNSLEKLDRKFAWLLALTFIIDGIVAIILYTFYAQIALIAQIVIYFIFGAIMSSILMIEPEKMDFWPHSFAPSITVVIILSIGGVIFWFVFPLPAYRFLVVLFLSMDCIFILWTILLQRQQRKTASNKPVE